MRRRLILLLPVLLAFFHLHFQARLQDGIPDNCEYSSGTYFRANVFPRYEPQNQRLVLVDWTTNAEVLTLATSLAHTRILGWSADCRYLAAAVGSQESMDTVVWDTVNNVWVGAVPDAHLKSHPITWGVHNYLVVETRNGAILWNVPNNTQITLTTSFNTTTGRNFSRLRWDGEHGQLIANLAVGGRVVYDLATGQEVAEAASAVPEPSSSSVSYNTDPGSTVALGGRGYTCRSGDFANLHARFVPTAGRLELQFVDLNKRAARTENVQMLDDQLGKYNRLERYDFGPGCRYLVAAMGIPERDATDTVVWDIIENRRVGIFPDAQQIHHPLHWSPDGSLLIVETRDGGYLWRLATDQRILLTESSYTALAGSSDLYNFHHIVWDLSQNQLLVTEVGSGHGVTVYDLNSGAKLGFYSSGVEGITASYKFTSEWLLVTTSNYSARRPGSGILYNRATGQAAPLPFELTGELIFSPDNQLLVHRVWRTGIFVWQTATMTQIRSYDAAMLEKISGFDFEPVAAGYSTYGSRSYLPRLNVLTGELIPTEIQNTSGTAVDSTSGYATYRDYYYNRANPACATANYDPEQRQFLVAINGETRVLERDVNQVGSRSFSLNCRYLLGEIGAMNHQNLPYDPSPLVDAGQERYTSTPVIWDVTTGERIFQFEEQVYGWVMAFWSPNSDYALLRTRSGSYVFNAAERRAVLLVFDREVGALGYGYYWDFVRGQILVYGRDAVYGFDLKTGKQLATYDTGMTPYGGRQNCFWYWWPSGCGFDVDGDNLYVYGDASFSVNNLADGSNIPIDTDYWLTSRHSAAISPDRRYAALVYGMANIWEIGTLPENMNDHEPLHRWNIPARARSARFIDNVTLEILTRGGNLYHLNVETGVITKGGE